MKHLKEAITYFSNLTEKILSEAIVLSDFEDLTTQQMNCMRIILRLKNPAISELAGELNLTKPTVTALVDKLVAKGYIKRVPSDTDRRKTHLHVELKGAKVEALREKALEKLARSISSALNQDEIDQLTLLLKKVVERDI